MDNRGAETHLRRRRDRQGLESCSEEGPALQDELKRTMGRKLGAGESAPTEDLICKKVLC